MAHIRGHPSWQLCGCHDRWNARNMWIRRFPVGDLLWGVFRDDGPPPGARFRLPDRPFAFLVPHNADYTALNFRIHNLLQQTVGPVQASFV